MAPTTTKTKIPNTGPKAKNLAPPTGPEPVKAKLVSEPLGFFKSLSAARRNLLEIFPEISVTQPMVSGKTGARWHMVMDPTSIRRILLEELDNYPKSTVTKSLLRPAIGDSLFIAEGAHWRWQRRAAAPAFTHRNIGNLGPIMTRAAEAASDRIAALGPRAGNMHEEMVRATFEVISDVTFSGQGGFDRDAVHQAIDKYIEAAGKVSLLDMLGAPDWMPRPSRITAGPALRTMKSLADGAITARQSAPKPDVPDLLDLLLAGADPETGRQMTNSELRDNLLAFIVAGHETTALTLAWALYLCAFDPKVQERAAQEARAHLGDRAATAQDTEALPLTRQIVEESMRLYPPAGLISRTALVPDTLCDREIRPGDAVMIPIYVLHRNRLLWQDADAFRPDRFADPKSIERFAYLPFGDGPRICIGASFAMQEAVIILATLLARFDFAAVPGRAPKPELIITTRPKGGVWLTAQARD